MHRMKSETVTVEEVAGVEMLGLFLSGFDRCGILTAEDRDRYYYGVDNIFRLQSCKMKTLRVSVECGSSRIDEAHRKI